MQIRVRFLIKGSGIKMRQGLRPDLNLQPFGPPDLLPRPKNVGVMLESESNRVVEREAARVRLRRNIAFHSRFDGKRAPADEKKQAGDQAQQR